ncbi:peptidoglycan-binding protein LysM [Flavilitoribacter nigricans]|uniref:Potassium binding protein Kbp n=1 Tax=Flavilitoribacter nigricans (strain ATCC 23147 / DSM 23189 / NBRC 102662 / NCIMB 1420 / SS-2) TaxID=1122177 RepID=A0A2D0MZ53_FLAN2|nr:peptidoglycan-binding protein LysM [Flavilitoribacter nigricans]PHN01408.1 peptidoglycan-binding protein LysM [Flavilitoribacter nigricans DSM 23189 = NBRC 102662]
MGLFSFIKDAGSKLFGGKKEEEKKVELSRQDALKQEIQRLGIPITNLDVDLGQAVTVSGRTSTNADREKIILALGNTEGVTAVQDHIEVANPEPEATFYEVKRGDSLSKISKAHYGDAQQYMKIFEANKPMLKDPNEIYPGQILRIPQ